jgi:hypothetical protein
MSLPPWMSTEPPPKSTMQIESEPTQFDKDMAAAPAVPIPLPGGRTLRYQPVGLVPVLYVIGRRRRKAAEAEK